MSVIVVRSDRRARQQLDELLPDGVVREVVALDQLVPGFAMETYDSPPGAVPAVEFTTHMAGVFCDTPDRTSLFWTDKGTARKHAVKPGMIFTTPIGPFGGMRWNGQLHARTVSITSGALEHALPEPFATGPTELRPIRIGDGDSVLAHLIDALYWEGKSGYLGGRLFAENLCHTIARYLAHRYGTGVPLRSLAFHGLGRERLRRILDYIDSHLATDLSVDTLSAVACLSPYHFGKMFKRSTGVTVHAYVVRSRIERAQGLLRSTNRTLSEVALACGFYDQSQMTAMFRRHLTTTPRRYRLHS